MQYPLSDHIMQQEHTHTLIYANNNEKEKESMKRK